MSKLILNPEYNLYERNGKAFASSRQVAGAFGKRHDHVLRDIANITDPNSGASKEFNERNFALVNYKDRTGRKLPEYLMTRDGFSLLAMGFTGKKAMAFKIAYINRFNEMEDYIHTLQTARIEYPQLTDAIMQAIAEPKPYHFSNEIDMINRIAIGMSAKQFKEENGVDKKSHSIRPYLTTEQIEAIEALQRADIGLILAAADFQMRKAILTNYLTKTQLKRLA